MARPRTRSSSLLLCREGNLARSASRATSGLPDRCWMSLPAAELRSRSRG